MLQAVLLQNCLLPFSPDPLQHDPCEQVLTVSWDGAEAEASLYSPFPSRLLSPRHIAVTPSHAFSLSQPCPDIYCALFMLQI